MEVLTGIQTVKAQNVEMVSRWKWQERYAKYIDRSYETITGTPSIRPSAEAVSADGARGRQPGAGWSAHPWPADHLPHHQWLCHPAVAALVHDQQRIQELQVSFERLADIVDTPEESTELDKGKIPLPPLRGQVNFNATAPGPITSGAEKHQPGDPRRHLCWCSWSER